MPKSITHELRLCHVVEPLQQFLTEVAALGPRLGCILAQLPPSLEFAPDTADAFFRQVRERYNGRLACEPRHASWFTSSVTHLFEDHAVARVAADPPLHPGADEPAGFSEFSYFRLHGSPQTYYSRYADETIADLARKLDAISKHSETWCIFDNTAAGHAADNALQLLSRLTQALR